MVIYTYALAHAIVPNVFWAPRLLAYLCVAIATILLGFVARSEFGPGFAFPTMWLFTPMVILPEIQQFTANTEMFLLLPLMGTVALCVFSLRNESVIAPKSRARWGWFLAGVLAGITVWYKYTAIPLIVTIFIGWSIRHCEQQGLPKIRGLLPLWFAAFAGASTASFATLAFFIVKGGLHQLWECTVLFNRAYAASATFSIPSIWFCFRLFWNSWWILFLLPWVLFIKSGRKVWYWALLFVGSLLATGASIYGHYYIVVTPFWAVLTVLAIHQCSSWLANTLRHSELVTRMIVTIAILSLICFSDFSWIARSKDQFVVDRLRTGNPFTESGDMARRVAELTSPSDYVYVAGSEPQILYYAKRHSPTRFVIAYPLTFPTPLAKGYQQEAIRELEVRPPAVIVLARSEMSWLIQQGTPREFLQYLEPLLANGYERIGGYIDEGARATWKEPLSDEELATSELVLYKRKPLNQL
jgi:hypothetical protein